VSIVDQKHHHQKVGCFEQELIHNVEDSFIVVHREEVVTESKAVLLWLAKLANKLALIEELLCSMSLCCLQWFLLECSVTLIILDFKPFSKH